MTALWGYRQSVKKLDYILESAFVDKFVIKGGNKLYGEISVSGAKNAAVAIIPATVLADGVCRIENIPNIKDVAVIASILSYMGAEVRKISDSVMEIDPRGIQSPNVSCVELVANMRASYYLLGAFLGKFSQARVPMPGGCDFCDRPVDQHLKAFELLGARCDVEEAVIDLKAEQLKGGSIYFDVVSVGATINAMLAAVKAKGLTTIENAAKEPHIVDVANFLNSMGANIRGAGTDVIKIRGVEALHGCTYSIIPDQIEAGTYMAAVAAAGGNVLIKDVIPKHLDSISAKLRDTGATVEEYDEAVRVIRENPLRHCNVKTMPHPGFPTDMQPQFVALLSIASGTSRVNESVWDDRFSYIPQLTRLGANITAQGHIAIIQGVESLKGAPVKAPDLRAGAALVIAGLVAKGVTEIEDIKYIERGYEKIVEKLTAVGADIRRVTYKSTYDDD